MTRLPTPEEVRYRRALGAEIREQRESHAWPQGELARVAGITQAAVSNYEHGKRDIRVGALLAIAGVLFPRLDAEEGVHVLLQRVRRRLERTSGTGHPGDRSAA